MAAVRIVPEGRAQAGDVIVDGHGHQREIVAIWSADTALVASPFLGFHAAACITLGEQTTGREKRDWERYLARIRRAGAA